jgi:hypothetical protein
MTQPSDFFHNAEDAMNIKWLLRITLFVLWLIASILLGALFLSVKESMGINIFTNTGYHAFTKCLQNEAGTAFKEEMQLFHH